jgi:hypothetical protein
MIGLAEICVLTSNFGQLGREFSPDEGAAEPDDAIENPSL